MNYLSYLMKFLAFVPSIAGTVETYSKGAAVATKLQHALDDLNLATAMAASILSEEEAVVAARAAVTAQDVLASIVQAVHDANHPPGKSPAIAIRSSEDCAAY